ncbi:MAG: gamma-butyrobetaine hydroxylase-like domain-containing protein, partial [Gammaproteobacteria bacterium]|nr:gamma-butyrobetaine hydroxylase-like domain-containing protein [Gammaproteobacteria bacterium]
MMATSAPTELKLRRQSRQLAVSFADGRHYELPFEYLRVFSPSAEVRGHGGEAYGLPKVLVIEKENVDITRIEPVGNYAVRLVFDDGHDSGLYTWQML